jgi:hypothetical protein
MASTTAKELFNEPASRKLRFEQELLQRLEQSAKSQLRSLNAEVNFRLRRSFENENAAAA